MYKVLLSIGEIEHFLKFQMLANLRVSSFVLDNSYFPILKSRENDSLSFLDQRKKTKQIHSVYLKISFAEGEGLTVIIL